MSKVSVWDRTGKAVGELEIADSRLTLDRGEQAVHDVVTAYLAGRRAGTASTLGKSEVAGSRSKPWRQKGLGRARAGYQGSPVWRGGGIAFGPHPRSYAKRVPRQVRDLAFRRALSEKIASGALRVVDSLEPESPKTRVFAAALKALGAAGLTVCAPAEVTEPVRRASRNLPRVEVVRARDLNVYQLLRYPLVLTDRAGWAVLEKRLAPAEGGAA
jgi:large subunit ribosomal protein L4